MQNHYNLDLPRGGAGDDPAVPRPGRRDAPLEPPRARLLAGNRDAGGRAAHDAREDGCVGESLYTPDVDFAVIDRAAEVAGERGVSTAQVALAWLLHKPGVTAPIVGTTRVGHLEDALAAADSSWARTSSSGSRSRTCRTRSPATRPARRLALGDAAAGDQPPSTVSVWPFTRSASSRRGRAARPRCRAAAGAAGGYQGGPVRRVVGVVAEVALVHDRADLERVDGDPCRPSSTRQDGREVAQRRLRRGVRGEVRHDAATGHRRGEHDAAAVRGPCSWATIRRAAACAPKNEPLRLRSTTLSQVASSSSRNGEPAASGPRSRRRRRAGRSSATACATRRSLSSDARERSPSTPSARPPRPRSGDDVSARAPARRGARRRRRRRRRERVGHRRADLAARACDDRDAPVERPSHGRTPTAVGRILSACARDRPHRRARSNRATLARQHLLAATGAAAARRGRAPRRAAGAGAARPVHRRSGRGSTASGPRRSPSCLVARDVVRIVVMRGTIHLVTRRRLPAAPAADAAGARRRARAAPRLRRRPLEGVDLAPVLALRGRGAGGAAAHGHRAARGARRAASRAATRRRSRYACRCMLALVQVPPRGVWGAPSQVTLDDRRGLARPAARRDGRRSTRSCSATWPRSGRRRSRT